MRGEPRCGDSKQELDATLSMLAALGSRLDPAIFTVSFELSHPQFYSFYSVLTMCYIASCIQHYAGM